MQRRQKAQEASQDLTTEILALVLWKMLFPSVVDCLENYVALVSVSVCMLHTLILVCQELHLQIVPMDSICRCKSRCSQLQHDMMFHACRNVVAVNDCC